MERIISGKNSEISKQNEVPPRKCSCPKNASCPLNGQCLEDNIVYHAKVTSSDQKQRNYIGLTSTDFKARLAQHKQTFKNDSKSQTSLSNHVHKLESENMQYEINWSIIDKGKSFTPVTDVCT